MKKILLIIGLFLLAFQAYAGPAGIFKGSFMGLLPRDGIQFKDNKRIYSGAVDPSAVATDALQGSLYMNPLGLFKKSDNGSSTNWAPLLEGFAGGGSSFFVVNQVGHGRAISFPLTPVYLTVGIWTDAQADTEVTVASHLIVQVVDANNFVVAQAGRYNVGAHGLAADTYFFTSDSVAGDLTSTSPVISNPIVFIEDANIIHVLPFRPSSSASPTVGQVDTVFGRIGNVVATNGDYTASEVTNVPAGSIIATNVQAAIDELETEKLNFPSYAVPGGIANAGANNIKITTHGSTSSNGGWNVVVNGEIFAISVQANAATTGGVGTFSPMINGVVQNGVGEQTTLDLTDTTKNFQLIASPIAYNAGDTLQAQSSTVAYGPTGNDLVITLWIRDR